MSLRDPLLVVKDLLTAAPTVTAIVGTDIYATPLLPVGHGYPLIRITHIGSNDYAPVGFRHSADALMQLDLFAADLPTVAALREAVLDTLHTRLPADSGATRIAVTSEVVDVDESVQPPLYRCRADVVVRIVQVLVP
jgi:hypothetical protein